MGKKNMQLVTVALNEASIDSPTFRAYVNYYQSKVNQFEEWINRTVKYVDESFIPAVDRFSKVKSNVLADFLPSPMVLGNGFVANQSFASAIVTNFKTDYTDFVERLASVIASSDSLYTGALMDLLTSAIEPYNVKRKNFDYYQNKYDSMLIQYQGLQNSPNHTNAKYLLNETQGVFDIKRSYLDASLNLIRAIAMLKLSVDKFLMSVVGQVNERNKFTFKKTGKVVNLAPEIEHYYKDYSAWVKSSIKSAKDLHASLQKAQDFIYDQTLKDMEPTDDLQHYTMKGLSNFNDSYEWSAKNVPKKAGWLFMKTTVGSGPSTREIWVRRWCYLDDIIFGIFLLSPSGTYVEETDKFGIELLTYKYLPDNPRRFCFEIKINDKRPGSKQITLTLQADNIVELRSWLQIFHISAQKYQSLLGDGSPKAAFGDKRLSPRFFEFASTTTTYHDQLLTTFSDKSQSLVELLKTKFTAEEVNAILEQRMTDLQMVGTSISTQLTPLAILSGYFKNTEHYFDAIQANLWGVNRWNQNGAVSFVDSDHVALRVAAMEPEKEPPNYPKELKIANLQFWTLFESINYDANREYLTSVNELLLFKFSSIWAPNRKQKFSSIINITRNYFYVYMNFSGFSHLSRRKIGDLISVEYDPKVKHMIKVHTVEGGHLTFGIYFTDYRAVSSKLEFLIECNATHKAVTTEQIIQKFLDIDQVYKDLSEREDFIDDPNTDKLIRAEYNLGKTFWNLDSTAKELFERSKQIQELYSKTYSHTYNIASKGLMHILFGDHSKVFPESIFFAAKNSNFNSNWYWKEEQDSEGVVQLVRNITFNLNRTYDFLPEPVKVLSTKQRIIKMIENKYYEVDQDPLIVKTPLCHPMKVAIKYVITESFDPSNHADSILQLSTNGCMLYVYYKVEFINTDKPTILDNLMEKLVLHSTELEYYRLRKIIHVYLDKIGSHGKVVKAINMCGLLGVSVTETQKSTDTVNDVESLDDQSSLQQSIRINDNSVNNQSSNGEIKSIDESMEGITLDEGTAASVVSKTGKINESNHDAEPITGEETFSGYKERYKLRLSKSIKQGIEKNATYDIHYSFGLLVKVFAKILAYKLVSLIFIILRLLILTLTLFKTVISQLNKTLLIGLSMSILFNIFLTGKSSVSYWTVRRADNIFQNYVTGNNKNIMERALSIKDLDLLTDYLAGPDDNIIFKKFNSQIGGKDNKFRETRKELAVRRNELLVELRILQNMEKELVQGDYRKFLINEIEKCKEVSVELPEVWEKDHVLKSYCNTCREEAKKIGQSIL